MTTSPIEPVLPPAPKRPTTFTRWSRRLGRLISFALLMSIVIGFAMIAPGPLTQEKTLVVPHGMSVAGIDALLSQENAIYTSPLFHIAARLVAHGSLKAGEYALPAHASPIEIAHMMHDGRSVVRLFTVAEGLTSSEITALLNATPALVGNLDEIPEEGTLLPETYRYDYGDTRMSIIARMKKSMQEKATEIWNGRDKDLEIHSLDQAVILASIVEKETRKPEERPRIAGVFYNRLRQNMRLQSDPTVIYALTKGNGVLDRPLTHDDLSFASPINTYANDGLPPQPICNPGHATLEAVVHPEHNTFLYFVADGTGGHSFAADLATQNENINKWHQILENSAPHK